MTLVSAVAFFSFCFPICFPSFACFLVSKISKKIGKLIKGQGNHKTYFVQLLSNLQRSES